MLSGEMDRPNFLNSLGFLTGGAQIMTLSLSSCQGKCLWLDPMILHKNMHPATSQERGE